MIIKFALEDRAFRIFDNATQVVYKRDIWPLPETVTTIFTTNSEGKENHSHTLISAESLEQTTPAEGDPPRRFETERLNLKYPYHLSLVMYELLAGLRQGEPYLYNQECVDMLCFCHSERANQCRYSAIEFFVDEKPYQVLTSFPVYLCNDDGKTIEVLR